MTEPESDASWIDRALRGGVAGVWRWNLADGGVGWGGSAPELLGAEALGTDYAAFMALVHEEDRDGLDARLQQSKASTAALTSEFRPASNPGRWIELCTYATSSDGAPSTEVLGWMHDVTARKNVEETLVEIAERVSDAQGSDFLQSLVQHLGMVLHADYAFVATFASDSRDRVRTVAMWANGEDAENIEYDLAHTPCELVVDGNVCLYRSRVQQAFEQDLLLQEMHVEGYAGVPLFGQDGTSLGLLVVLWKAPVPEPHLARAALKIFGARAGSEFERQAAHARQARGAAQLALQQRALAELSQSPLWQTGDRDALLRQICELASKTLGVGRIGIWLFDPESTKLMLVDLYEREPDAHSAGVALSREVAPAYFYALGADRVIAAHDARTDPRTREFADSYLDPTGITSMLDAPIRVHGSTVGVICCEHVGPPRRWLPEEESFSGSLADFAGLAIDLADKRALQQQLLQKQALESIGRLAGGVAHDFNNLLTTISGGAELALDGIDTPPLVETLLKEIQDATQRAADLTSQLLGFARKRVIEPRVLDLNEVVKRADRILRRLIGEDVSLRVSLSPDLWKVRVDPGQFEQILVNLAVNARDAMPEGGKLLIETSNQLLSPEHARRHPSLGSDEHVLLAVSDTGCGIPAEVLPHVFEPFFTTKPQGRGTGLGLATCYGIVMQAGGQIFVYSEVAQGTTFKIYLPRATDDTDALEPAKPTPRRCEGDETLLLVEDDERVRRMAQRGLDGFGYHTLVASTPSEALELAEAHRERIDLVVTDVVLPQMSGRKLADELTRRHPGLRVLYVSGYTENGVVHQGVLESNVNFLPKPFTPRKLAERVRAILDAD